ncbi:MAG: hypothetical protein V7L14_12505 [Nostoc sp.]|uniref:hypothetical protein n=1 Tax=Nostoc sp. TaxID=1180 RepID=UPI002FF57C2C
MKFEWDKNKNQQNIQKHGMSISPNRLKELQNIPDTAIDTSDIPELDQQFWETAKMVKSVSQEATLIQLDQDFKANYRSQSLVPNILGCHT